MQEQILFFLQSIATPFADLIFNIFTMFGEDLIIISIIAWIYWNHDKYQGFILSFTLISSLVLNNSIKILFRSPRPFQVYPDLIGKRIHTATGYSFPSGHTQGAATFYSSLAIIFKKKSLISAAIVIIIAVALSRLYLAVHWPVDVIASILLGIIFSVILVPYLKKIEKNPVQKMRFILILNIISVIILVIAIICKILVFKNELMIVDLIKMTGLLNGISWGYVLDMKKVIFIVNASVKIKILRFLAGLAGAFILMEGLKILLPPLDILQYLRYGMTGFWIVWLYPYLGEKIKLFSHSD